VLHTERVFGKVTRSFTLPQEVDEAKAEAKYHDGVLELTLPKKAGSRRKSGSLSSKSSPQQSLTGRPTAGPFVL